jgi:hypothetical protein
VKKSTGGRRLAEQAASAYPNQPAPSPLRRRRRTRYVFVSSLPSPSATLAAPDEGAQTVPTEKATTEKGKRRVALRLNVRLRPLSKITAVEDEIHCALSLKLAA